MIAGLDSSFDRPSTGTAAAARAAGVRVWGGYIGTRSGLGLAVLWSQADFDVIRNAGMTPIGFCSGWDDPAAIRDRAAAWGVLLCVDVEAGIRNDGSWVQPWLDAAGAGLYGLCSVHRGRFAAFHVISLYPGGDPSAVWPTSCARPAGPVGWQWQGGHSEFGLNVDRSWLDDWFGAPPPSPQPLLGGDSAMTLSIAARPDRSGVDVFRVAPDGNIYWQGNTPYWQQGAWGQISNTGDSRGVSAQWVDADSLLVTRVDKQGRAFQNALHPSTGWKFGAWVENGAPWMVPAAVGDLPAPATGAADTALRAALHNLPT